LTLVVVLFYTACMNTLFLTESQVDQAGALIKAGHLVVFPTETVYGLGADAFNEDACKRIFDAKGRPQDNPLIVHIYDSSQLKELTVSLPPCADSLMKAFWPGPLTLVLPKSCSVGSVVTAGLDTVGIRMPVHPVARELLRLAGTPVAAPSANRSGKPSPTNFAMACSAMSGRVAAIVDGGECENGLESTVLGWSSGTVFESGFVGPDTGGWVILRPGSVTREDLTQVLGPLLLSSVFSGTTLLSVRSPGTRHPHYRPRCPVVLFYRYDDLAGERGDTYRDWALIGISDFQLTADTVDPADQADQVERFLVRAEKHWNGQLRLYTDWKELARRLYSDFFELDSLGVPGIVVQIPKEDGGIGEALRNRASKAADGQFI